MSALVFPWRTNINDNGAFFQQLSCRWHLGSKDTGKKFEHTSTSFIHDGHASVFPSGNAGFEFKKVGKAHIDKGLSSVLRPVSTSTNTAKSGCPYLGEVHPLCLLIPYEESVLRFRYIHLVPILKLFEHPRGSHRYLLRWPHQKQSHPLVPI